MIKRLIILWAIINSYHVLPSLQSIEGYNLLNASKLQYSLKDRISVLIFLSKTCPCSNEYVPYLKNLQKTYPNILFLGIHSNKRIKKTEAQVFYRNKSLNFPVIDDKKLFWAKKLQALKTPHVYVYQNGVRVYHGGIANSRFFKNAKTFYLEEVLVALVQRKNIPYSEGRALGCYIQR